jgi:hypothetical protein
VDVERASEQRVDVHGGGRHRSAWRAVGEALGMGVVGGVEGGLWAARRRRRSSAVRAGRCTFRASSRRSNGKSELSRASEGALQRVRTATPIAEAVEEP